MPAGRTTREVLAGNERAREYLSPQDLAEELGVPVGTIYQWNHRGGGPSYVRVGRHVRFRRSDVDAWLDANVHSPQPAA